MRVIRRPVRGAGLGGPLIFRPAQYVKTLILVLIPLFLVPSAKAERIPGHFVLVGGGGTGAEIRSEFLRLAGGRQARIVVIPSASSVARPEACAALWRASAAQVTILHARDRREAADPNLYACLDQATGVWICGGKQSRLMYLFGGTPLSEKLKAVLARGGVVGGTSAGASVVTSIMVLGRNEGRGLGLLPGYIIDQHFSERHRFARLQRLVEMHVGQTGYGIDERTALIISGDSIKVLGPGTVTRFRAPGDAVVLRATH